MDEWFMVQEGDFVTDVAVESADGNLNVPRKMDADIVPVRWCGGVWRMQDWLSLVELGAGAWWCAHRGHMWCIAHGCT